MSVLDNPVKPGTVLLVIAVAAIGLSLYNWASAGFKDSGTELRQTQEKVIDCGSVEINFREISYGEKSNNIFFTTTANIPFLYVETERKIHKIPDVRKSGLNNISYRPKETSYVAFKANDCVFRNFTVE